MTNKLKKELKNIEIPSELHKHSKMGIMKAKSEIRRNRRKFPKVLPSVATVACLALVITLGVSQLNNESKKPSLQKKAVHKITSQEKDQNNVKLNTPIVSTQKKAQAQVQDDQNNQWLEGVENLKITHSEFSTFQVFLKGLNKDRNLSNSDYANKDLGTIYAYSKLFKAHEVNPEMQLDEQALMDQVKKVILSNKDPLEVNKLKSLISQFDAKDYSPKGSYNALSSDYKKIADLAKNYQLPKSGVVPKSSSWYDSTPNEVIYTNGYGFNQKTGEMFEIIVPKGQSKKKPTKAQYLGVIEGKTAGIINDVGDPRDSILSGASNMSKEDLLKHDLDGFSSNRQDIQVKLKAIGEMKNYSGDYPLIKEKLDRIESILNKSLVESHSTTSIRKAVNLYESGVDQINNLYKAFQVGQDLRNDSN